MFRRILAAISWAYRSLFYDSSNTLSLGRVSIIGGLLHV